MVDYGLTEILLKSVKDSNIPHVISSIDGDNEIIYANEAFLQDTGYDLDEVIGRNCRFLQGEKTSREAIQFITQKLKNFEPIDVELMNYKKDGSIFLNKLKISTIFDDDGSPIAFIGIQNNITSSIENVKSELWSKKIELLGQNAANISHEIRNGLQPIKLMMSQLENRDGLSKEEIDYCIGVCKDNLEITEKIVNDILSYSKKENSAKIPKNLNDIIEMILEFIRFNLNDNIKIIVNNHVGVKALHSKFIQIDSSLFLQVINNLIRNSSYAMKNKGIIELSFNVKVDSFEISIKDSGGGCKEVDQIFQEFYSDKPADHGTGLGLSICKKTIENHDGTIIAQNCENGLEMLITMPIS